jgi:4-hydroxythreonine-4-phosphate dehydrogenase
VPTRAPTKPAPRPTIAITLGDPGGIGPEVVAKALADPALRKSARIRIFGPAAPLESAARAAGIKPFWTRTHPASPPSTHDITLLDYPAPPDFPHQPSRASGDLSFRLVEDALIAAKRPPGDPARVDAIVTAPISKHAWQLAGRGQYPGHTELFTTRLGARRSGMMFVSPQLRVILVTAHIPLMGIASALSIGRVFDAIDLGAQACTQLGIAQPRIAVCGLNPHAGEDGLLGDEDARIIQPAIRAAQEAGIDARGPFPGDTIFNAAVRGSYDLVVAMYHDQGLIPVKLLAWDKAVNMTVGLPTIRTSPDHGTAFDIAGKNKADPGSMRAAIDLAIHMASLRAAQLPTAAPSGPASPPA